MPNGEPTQSSGHRIAGTAAWLVAERVLNVGLGLVVGIWLIRHLGPSEFGQLALALSIVALFGSIGSLGLDSIVVRNLVTPGQRPGDLLGTTLVLRAVASGVAGVLALGVAMALSGGTSLVLMVGMLALAGLPQALGSVDAWYQAEMRPAKVVAFRSAIAIAAAVAKAFAIYLASGPLVFSGIYAVATAVGGATILLAFLSEASSPRPLRFVPDTARALLAESWPLIIEGLAVTVYMRIDQLMLGALASVSEVGTYAGVVRLTEATFFIPVIAVSAAFPIIARARHRLVGREYARATQEFLDVLALLGFSIAIPVVALAPQLLEWLLGPLFSSSHLLLRVHAWSILLVALGVGRAKLFVAEGWTKIAMWSTVAGGVTNMALNLVAIPLWGASGAAGATLVAQAVAVLGPGLVFRNSRETTLQVVRAVVLPLRPGALVQAARRVWALLQTFR